MYLDLSSWCCSVSLSVAQNSIDKAVYNGYCLDWLISWLEQRRLALCSIPLSAGWCSGEHRAPSGCHTDHKNMGRAEIQLWGKEIVSAGSQCDLGHRLHSFVCLWSQWNCAMEEISFPADIFVWKKCGGLNILGKASHPRRVCLPNLLKRSLPLTFLFILAHKY